MSKVDQSVSVREAARFLGVSEKTLRRWDQSGVLVPARNPVNGYRVYARDALVVFRGRSPRALVGAPSPRARRLHGRHHALDELSRQLRRAGGFVTVTGAPGVGKSRLVREAFRRDRGAVVCDVEGCRTETELVARVAAALGCPAATSLAGLLAATSLAGLLAAASGPRLLVLDGIDRLVHARGVIERALAAAPVRLVVTSHAPLASELESIVRLGPLDVPAPDCAPSELLSSPSVRMLADCLGLRELGPERVDPAARIARASDGVPFALEVLAGLAEIIPLERLADLVTREGLVLARGELRERCAVVEAALSPEARSALAQLAVFRGSCGWEAIRAVVRVPGGDGALVGAIRSLAASSLLERDDDAPQPPRFRLLAPIREVAHGRLSEQPTLAASARRRHAQHHLGRAERMVGRTGGALDPVLAYELAWEGEDLEAAASSRRGSARRRALVAAIALARAVGYGRAEPEPHVVRLARLVGADIIVDPLACQARVALGDARWYAGDAVGARGEYERALTDAVARGFEHAEAVASVRLATVAGDAGELDRASALLDRALVIARAAKSERLSSMALGIRGRTLHSAGALEGATAAYREARDAAQRVGDGWSTALLDASCAAVHRARGELKAAVALYASAAGTLRHDPVWGWIVRGYSAATLWQDGDVTGAVALFRRARREGQPERRMRRFRALFLAQEAAARAELDGSPRTEKLLAEARALATAATDPHLALVLEGCSAIVAAVRGERASARDTLERLRTSTQEDVRPVAAALGRVLAARAAGPLLVAPDGRWFAPPERAVVSLERHPALTRVLACLVERRRDGRGEVVSVDTLFAQGWPSDAASETTRAVRVRGAIATLRRLGLRAHLLTARGGYLLDPRRALRARSRRRC